MYANRSSATFLAVFIAATAAPAQTAAQDVTYETVTKTELTGAAGAAVRIAARLGGGSMEVVERTSIKGKKMRVDVDQSSTITDLENGRIIMLDHDAKTYTSFTFGEMIQRAQQAVGEASAAADSDERTEAGAADPTTRMEFSFSVDDPGQREKIAGYDAQRFFLTMQAETEYIPEGESQFEKGGTLVVFTDLWTSKDVPELDVRGAFDQATAQEYAQASASLTEGIAAAFANDPKLAVAFEKSVQEASKIEGTAVRTNIHFVMVAPDEQFSHATITDPPQRGGLRQAARGGLGRLAARAAGAREEQAQEEPTQVTILTVKSELRNISTRSVDAKLFEIPEGFSEVKF